MGEFYTFNFNNYLICFLVQLNKFWLDIIMEIFSIILALILNNRFLLAIINAIFNRLRK